MPRDINIDLNTDHIGPAEARADVARLVLTRACGYTRDGGTPTISADCGSITALEGEASRLKGEIDDALERARAYFQGKAAVEPRKHAAKAAETGAKPHLAATLRVRDVMTRNVRTVDRNDRLSVADEVMRLGSFRHVVVLDENESVAGVVSSRDIFHGALAWSLGVGRAAHEKSLATYPVKQVMNADVVTIAPDTDLREAAAIMAERKIGCLPVVDGSKLVGILTEGDFLALLTSE